MIHSWVTLITLIGVLAGCVTETVKTASVPTLATYESELADDEILDIAVVVFDPGIAEADVDENIYPEIRRAEAAFVARELALVLDDQGVWGASRVVPSPDYISDVVVSGSIEQSDGESLVLNIEARDARGRVWLHKAYSGSTSRYAYQQTQRVQRDPFLGVYRKIANDLILAFKALSREERLAIRNVARLKFAQSFAPNAFADYLQTDDSNITRAVRLPAESDPMMTRISAIQQRNHVFVDTLQGHYDNFSGSMEAPYNEWRRLSYEETIAIQALKRESKEKLTTGTIAIIASIAAASSDNRAAQIAGIRGIAGAGGLIKQSLQLRAEAKMHSLTLEELGQSLEAEITPQVIELEDRTVQLSGSIEDQYSQWREILSDIYAAEIAELPTSVDKPSS